MGKISTNARGVENRPAPNDSLLWGGIPIPDLYAREGHFVWILGMLLTLFSREIAQALFGVNEGAEQNEPARA
jgi:hypothetical protein